MPICGIAIVCTRFQKAARGFLGFETASSTIKVAVSPGPRWRFRPARAAKMRRRARGKIETAVRAALADAGADAMVPRRADWMAVPAVATAAAAVDGDIRAAFAGALHRILG